MTMLQNSKIQVLTLEGSPKERGKIHGETLKSSVLEVLERYKFRLRLTLNADPDEEIDRMLTNTNFLAACKQWAPQLLEEVEGIATGVGVDFNEIFAMHIAAHDEQWWFTHKPPKDEHCSSIGCFRETNKPTLLAQNMDLNQMFEGLEVLLHIKHPKSDLESLVLSHAGFLAECGLNNQPVGICCNSLTSSLKSSSEGLPVTFIVRSVLEQPNLEKAIEFINMIQHASGQNYCLGGIDRVVSLECSAHQVNKYIPFENAKRIYHTNHPLVNDDLINKKRKRYSGSTVPRFQYLEHRLKDPSKKITVKSIKNILSSHFGPVCVHHNSQPYGAYTYSSVVYELSKSPSLHVTVGPPCSNSYEKFDFN
jgi:isopenicillin-N N-acyltransferase like protein